VIARAPCDSAVSAKTHKQVTLGRISGVFGVQGWVKVHSFTDPRENVVTFKSWLVRLHGDWRRFEVEAGHRQGAGVVAKLRGIDDPDGARELIGADIVVERHELPPCAADEYYWTDLEGLEVRTTEGQVLGTVDHLIATPGHDVLVLIGDRERLVPFALGRVIREVDLEAGRIVADWSPDY
jgi:16S rRNA processing protein RimM